MSAVADENFDISLLGNAPSGLLWMFLSTMNSLSLGKIIELAAVHVPHISPWNKCKNYELNVVVVFGCGCGWNFSCYLRTGFLPHQALWELVLVGENKVVYHWGNNALRSEFLIPPCGLFERGFYDINSLQLYRNSGTKNCERKAFWGHIYQTHSSTWVKCETQNWAQKIVPKIRVKIY